MSISDGIALLGGIALFLFGMSLMGDGLKRVAGNKLELILYQLSSTPIRGILLGTGVTAVIQSSSATSVMVVGFVNSGMMKVRQAIGIVLGAILGTTMTTVSIALMNTLFRLATVIALTPMIGLLEKIVCMLFPERDATPEEQDMDRLEARFLQHPALAIEQSRLVTCSMAQKAQMNLLDAMSLRHDYSDEGFERVEKLEGIVDRYEDRLGTYLVQITRRELLDRQNEDVSKFLHTITDFERISDHALNIAEACRELHEKDVAFSPEAEHELDVMESAIREIVSIAIRAFTENDLHLAGRVEPLEEIVDGLCDQLKSRHVGRLQQGVCTLKLGFVFNDLLTNYERVADHCSNIAVALIELESDVFDTHAYLNSVHELKSETYDRYYDEYQKKFAI